MRDAANDWDIETEGLLGPAEADIVVDPASLEHLASDASLAPRTVSGADEALVLTLEDLLPDVDGAVDMLADDSLPVNLVTDQPLAGSGVVDGHASAGGVEVEGLFYYSFANGLTLYSDTDIVIVNQTVGT
jgi:hypothetical protein